MRYAVTEPAPQPVSPRGHRPPDGAVTGRVHLRERDAGPPGIRLGEFTERLLVHHVHQVRRPRRRLGWLPGRAPATTMDEPGRERRLLPGEPVRALTSRGR